MELRKAEGELSELRVQYERLRGASISQVTNGGSCEDSSSSKPLMLLPPIVLDVDVKQKPDATALDEQNDDTNDEAATTLTAREALSLLESLREALSSLEAKCAKFRKRLGETDPISGAPRYGEKTAARASFVLRLYDALCDALVPGLIPLTSAGESSNGKDEYASGGTTSSIVQSLRDAVEKEDQRARQAVESTKNAQRNEESRAVADAKRLEEEEKKRESEDERLRIALEADLRQQAIEARRRREEEELRVEREAREADRAFVASIPKGADGVRKQLQILREGCMSEPGAFDVAIGAIHTLFSQITAHPEEIKFRRIRRDHPKFNEDIGRHAGGKEIFVAAGFTLESLDGVNIFFSKEPDLESDMDAWSDWFDGLKKTLQIIEEEMIK